MHLPTLKKKQPSKNAEVFDREAQQTMLLRSLCAVMRNPGPTKDVQVGSVLVLGTEGNSSAVIVYRRLASMQTIRPEKLANN